MGYIYKITNKINNKIYIGQTRSKRATDRFSKHRYMARHPEQEKRISYLHRAMALDGIENFSFEIIEDVPNETLNEREKYWIETYNSMSPNGYNLTLGGEGTPGFSRTQTEDEKKRKQQSMKKYIAGHPEFIEEKRQRTKNLGKNPEYREKVTESNKKFYQEHPDMFRGVNNPFYGRHHTEETIKKLKEKAKPQQRAIAQLDKDSLETIQNFDGVREAERTLGVSHGGISRAAESNGISYGYRWKFI